MEGEREGRREEGNLLIECNECLVWQLERLDNLHTEHKKKFII